MIEVIQPGPLTTVQDLGRPGWAHVGVPCSGAADRHSLRLANRLVANAEDQAALETTLAGPRLRFDADCIVAVTGAESPVHVGQRECSLNAPIHVHAGESLSVGSARAGLRNYISIRGGILTGRTLGSSASDLLTGIGPPPLRVEQRLQIGPVPPAHPNLDVAPVAALSPEPVLSVSLGPRDDWFLSSARELLASSPYEIDSRSNRTGIRLNGPPLARENHDELLSEAVIPGALQVPPSGQPILLLVDHPTTGGYPVIGVVPEGDLAIAAQLRPGQRVRFRPVRIGET